MQYVRPVDLNAFPRDDFHSEFVADRTSGLDSCICIVTRVPPGKGSPWRPHTHPADQLYYVLRGEMRARIGEREVVARPQDLVYIPAGVPHWNWNAGGEDEVHFELIAPQPPAGMQLAEPVDASAPAPSMTDVGIVRSLDESRFAPDRWSQVVLADRSSGVPSVSLGVFRVPPSGPSTSSGRSAIGRLHVHRFDQIYYVISGRMRLQIGLEEHEAGPNTLVILPAGMPHRSWNEGPEPELHLNLRVPEPADPDMRTWDLPVQIGEAS